MRELNENWCDPNAIFDRNDKLLTNDPIINDNNLIPMRIKTITLFALLWFEFNSKLRYDI